MKNLTKEVANLSLSSTSITNEVKKDKFELLPHQKEAIKFINNCESKTEIKGGFLSMDCGLGKTFTLLNHIYTEKVKSKKNSLNLVVCPKTAMYTWKNEV